MTRPIDYIERMAAHHDDQPPYRWLTAAPAPLTALRVPLEQARVALVGLAGVYVEGQEPFSLKDDTSVRLIPSDITNDRMRVAHFGFKLERARADVGTVFPLAALRRLASDGAIGEVATDAVSAMGAVYSQRRLSGELVPNMLGAVQPLGADIVVIVPSCPLDHQTAAAIANAIEAYGTVAIVMSGARDIVQRAGAPRAVYVHAPLGWLAGMPGDAEGQRQRLAAVLRAGVGIDRPGEVADLPAEYPLGAAQTPQALTHPDLIDWERREYTGDYSTGADRDSPAAALGHASAGRASNGRLQHFHNH